MNFVPCLAWVRKGGAKEVPEKVKLSKEELKKLIEESITDIRDLKVENEEEGDAPAEGDNSKEEMDDAQSDEEDDVLAKYNMDAYDDEQPAPLFTLAQFADVCGEDGTQDPIAPNQDVDSDDEENFKIRPSDNLIAVGHVNDDCSTLEVYVYNEEDDDLYVHHDIILPAYPLCMEWLNYDPTESKPSNYLAVGDMTPVINIWDLDMVDILEPVSKLGKKIKKKDKKKGARSEEDGHSDAVLDLSWNKHMSHILASGSADQSVILWDLTTSKPANHLRHHTEKVQCVRWHPFEAEILLTGGCDKLVSLYDCRAIEEKKSWTVDDEVEKILWNHLDPFSFLVGTAQGTVYSFDVRQDSPVFTFEAHDKAISDMTLSSSCPGCLVTTANDISIKVWDIRNNQPTLVESRKLKLGNVFSCRGSPDSPFMIAAGGDKASSNFKVIDLLKSQTVKETFAPQGTSEALPLPSLEQPVVAVMESAVASSSQGSNVGSHYEKVHTNKKKVLKKKSLSKTKR